MPDITRAISPSSFTPLFNTTAAPQAPAEATPLPPIGSGRANDALGRNEFLKLLVAQMKNQDPLNPMDGQEMAAQLAQFSQVEQLIEINEGMKAVSAGQEALGSALDGLSELTLAQGDAMARLLEQSMAINTVGRTGVVEGNQLFVDRDGNGAITIDAGTTSGSGRLRVVNSEGVTIATGGIGDIGTGIQSIELSDFGFDPPLPEGRYTFRFDVLDDNGAADSGADLHHRPHHRPALRAGRARADVRRLAERAVRLAAPDPQLMFRPVSRPAA